MPDKHPTAPHAILIIILTCSTVATPHAANKPHVTTEGTHQGQTKADETLDALRTAVKRNKNDLAAWNHLGLAL